MKRLIAAALLAVVSVPAFAAMNIRQQSDGTAKWEGRTSDQRFDNCVGGNWIYVPVDLNSLSTNYGIVPITNAVIKGAYSVAQGTLTGTTTLEIYVGATNKPLSFRSTTTGLATTAQIHVGTASAGTVDYISSFGDVSGANSLASNTAIEGTYVAVQSNGGGTATVSGAAYILVCPR